MGEKMWCVCSAKVSNPTEPMQLVALVILGSLPEYDAGNSYIPTVADYFTRQMEAYSIPNQQAQTVAKKITEELFFWFSPPGSPI